MCKTLRFIAASATLAAAFGPRLPPFSITRPNPTQPKNPHHPGPLRFNKDGKFQIAVFADLHHGENAWESWGPQQDIYSQKVMRTVLDAEKQDLVVLNGDLITGENVFKSNASIYVDTIVRPLIERNLPWASTYGNHDSSFNLSRSDILRREQAYPNALTTQMVHARNAGVSNYYLPIYPSSGGSKPCLILWFFDSRGGTYYQQTSSSGASIGQPNWVDQSVVDWFRTTHRALTAQHGDVIPSLGFVHIPTDASTVLQTSAGVNANKQPGDKR